MRLNGWGFAFLLLTRLTCERQRPQQQLDVKLDPEVILFVRTLKAENQRAAKEPGYSGFLEELVRASEKFQRWQRDQ